MLQGVLLQLLSELAVRVHVLGRLILAIARVQLFGQVLIDLMIACAAHDIDDLRCLVLCRLREVLALSLLVMVLDDDATS